jgi:branched-chain amino acid transport system substrate-binding protein
MRQARGTTSGTARGFGVVIVLAAMVLSACGSHLSRGELEAANGSLVGLRTSSGGSAAGSSADATGEVAADGTSGGAVGGGATGSGSGASATGTRSGSASGAKSGSSGGGSTATNKPEILLGSFGAESGVLGAVSGPAPPAIRAWVPYINSHGGINGHPVRVIQADDGADPARTQSIVRKMVEEDKVVGFFGVYSFTTSAALPYLESKSIPLFGTVGADAGEDHSPMVFKPELASDEGNAWSFISPLDEVLPPDKRKLAILYCREVAVCEAQKNQFANLLPFHGLTVVYEAEASLAQPDYTAEVLGARNAGADVIANLLDSASVIRVAQAVERQQGYRPILSGSHNLDQDLLLQGGERLKGAIIASRQPPYHTGPLLQFYRDAMAQYQPRATKGSLGAGVFTQGKLLADVISKGLPDGQVTSADFLKALLTTVKNETLGGLYPGITFGEAPQGRPYTNLCIVTIIFDGKTFNPFNPQSAFRCPPGWTTGKKPSAG